MLPEQIEQVWTTNIQQKWTNKKVNKNQNMKMYVGKENTPVLKHTPGV